jgi:YidC/Oxa1 family membrane protein insertase
MFDGITNIVTEGLRWLNGIIGSYGWTLIAVGVLIRLVTWPLQLQQMRSQKAMAQLNPQLEALKKKYKDDREKLTQAQMELYKEAGINPLGGCAPLLIQFPVLIILYNAIRHLALDPGFAAPFLWLPNLAAPEGIPPIWPFTQFFHDVPAAPLFIPILVVLMIITGYIQQQLMPMSSSDPQSAQMASSMRIMTLVFPLLFINFPAGLSLYYVVQNLTGIILQYLFLGAGQLRIPNPPWVRDEPLPNIVKNGAVPATEPAIIASADGSDDTEIEPNGDVAKRRANVRTKKKRRG